MLPLLLPLLTLSCNISDPSTYIKPQIAAYERIGNRRRYYACGVTPLGAQVLAQSEYWAQQQYTSRTLMSKYALGPMCTRNTSLVFGRAGLPSKYQSDMVLTQLKRLKEGEELDKRYAYFKPTLSPAQWPEGIESLQFVSTLNSTFEGYFRLGSAVFGCTTKACANSDKDEHSGIICNVTRSYTNRNALVYWLCNNYWPRKEKATCKKDECYSSRCEDWSREGLGSMGNWMVPKKWWPSEAKRIASAKWSSVPLYEVEYRNGVAVKAKSVQPIEFDDMVPWRGFHIHVIVPVEIHRQLNKSGPPCSVVEFNDFSKEK